MDNASAEDETMRSGKKSQMEIMGLALVVVLISLGLLFFIKFSIRESESPNIRKSVTESALASNLLSTMLSTTAKDCSLIEIKDLVHDCASNNQIVCENNQGSCEYLNSFFDTIFKETLESWNRSYEFTVTNIPENYDLDRKFGDCSGELESKFFAIPAENGKNVVLTLNICR